MPISETTAYVYDHEMLLHHDPFSSDHPEQPARIHAIHLRLEEKGLLALAQRVPSRYATHAEITSFHTASYHTFIVNLASTHNDDLMQHHAKQFDSVYFSSQTPLSALLAAGSTIALAEHIASDSSPARNGLAIVRPPGHHAEYDQAMGFCIYNNVVVAAQALLQKQLARRILILDWDVHHGNGTQNAFLASPDVLFISIHRYDNGRFYPHSCSADMDVVGSGDGAGRTINVPWPGPGFGDGDYVYAFTRLVLPVAREFNPDFVFVSAGFDAANGDPIGGCLVTPAGFALMVHMLMGVGKGRLMLALEGGYNVSVAADCVEACFRVLLGEPALDSTVLAPSLGAAQVVESVVQIHSPYWDCLYPKQLPKPTISAAGPSRTSLIPLQDLVDSHWRHVCTKQLGLIELQIPLEHLQATYGGRIHLCDKLLSNCHTIVLFAHETSPLFQHGLSVAEADLVSPKTTFQHQYYLQYLQEALRRNYAVMDICIPSHKWKLKQASAGTTEQIQRQHELMLYLWDNFLSISGAKNVFIVGSGLPVYSLANLVDSRHVEDLVKGIVLFSSTLYLPIIRGSSSESEREETTKPSPDPKDTKKSHPPNPKGTDLSGDEFSDGFDAELMGDKEDRKRLAAMTEVEREAVLYERAQARQTKIERKELEKKIHEREMLEQQNAAMKLARKQRAPSSEIEKKRQRLDDLKARRERKRRKAESDSDYHDSDAAEEGEVDAPAPEEEPPQPKKKAPGPVGPIDFETANQLRLPRSLIEKWMYHPQFDEMAKGCLLRVSIGMHGGATVYRLGEIRKIVPYHRAYRISPNLLVNKAAVLRHGKSEKTFRLDIASNSPFTQAEYDRWLAVLKDEQLSPPTLRLAQAKIEAWREIEQQPISDDLVMAMVQAKKELGQGRRNLVAERTVLQHQREEALASGNAEELERIDEELGQLLRELEQQQAKKPSNQKLEALAELNRRNRQINVIAAREAERKSSRRTDGESSKHDPFSRRKCQPSSLHVVSDLVPQALPADENPDEKTAAVEPASVRGATASKVDLFSVHNVDIDIDI